MPLQRSSQPPTLSPSYPAIDIKESAFRIESPIIIHHNMQDLVLIPKSTLSAHGLSHFSSLSTLRIENLASSIMITNIIATVSCNIQ